MPPRSKLNGKGYNVKQRLAQLLENMKNASIVIVGDVMLDEYIIGDSKRISPEAPEPVIEEEERRHVPGGAANVAVNATELGAKASLIGIVGNDPDGGIFCDKLAEKGVDPSTVIASGDRPHLP